MSTTPHLATMLVLGASALLSSCAAGATTTTTSPKTITTAATTTTTNTATTTTTGSDPPVSNDEIDPGLQPYIDIAVADLTTRRSIDAAAVTVSSATLVEWPDSSLGCPAPGQAYAQVTTDGALIVLTVDGKPYQYHAGGSRPPFLCENPAKSVTNPSTTTL